MTNLRKYPIVYVTRDLERALGVPLDTPGYFIISNFSPFAKSTAKGRKNILLIKERELLDTYKLLEHQKTKQFIKKNKAKILVFKNTPQIEKTCAENGWQLLNPSAELSSKVEEKISQIEWLGPLKKYLPNYTVLKCKEIYKFLESQNHYFFSLRNKARSALNTSSLQKNNDFVLRQFVLQFNRSHTGSGTFLIENEKQLNDLAQKFPEREARIAPYIEGPLLTNNNIVAKDTILHGNISYQITGLVPFTDNPFTTIGNDWELPHKILTKKQILEYKKIATEVGVRLREHGWKGLFGIDVILEQKTGKLFLLEINCRQPASTTYESQLQSMGHDTDNMIQVTTFEAHLLSLLDRPLKKRKLTIIKSGAQIIQRVTRDIPTLKTPKFHKPENRFKYILYPNTNFGADLLRIQTKNSIMEKHNQLNDLGRNLLDFIFCVKHENIWNAPRAAVFIIKEKKILLLKREKCGKKYYVFPGGTLEKNETLEQTAIREAKEETGLKIELSEKKPWQSKYQMRDEYYFFVEKFNGQVALGGPEAKNNHPLNHYEIAWVKLSDLPRINLLPEKIKTKLCHYLKKP